MRNMSERDRKQLMACIICALKDSVGWEYANRILKHKTENTKHTFMEDVINDVIESSAWDDEGDYSDDDVRLAIGRVFMDRLGINS